MKACKQKELKGKTYRCFFELTLLVMGGKWKPVIIYHLGEAGRMRFGELRRSLAGVTERMLTKQLRELEADGVVHREVFREVPPRVEYWLTPLGARLMPILRSLRDWGETYEEQTGLSKAYQGEGFEPRQAACSASTNL